jgi:hypothetical protein
MRIDVFLCLKRLIMSLMNLVQGLMGGGAPAAPAVSLPAAATPKQEQAVVAPKQEASTQNAQRDPNLQNLSSANPQSNSAPKEVKPLEKLLNVLAELGIPKDLSNSVLKKLGLVNSDEVSKQVELQLKTVLEAKANEVQEQANIASLAAQQETQKQDSAPLTATAA